MSNPHSDHAGWAARLRDALGTCSDAFVSSEMGRIAKFLQTPNGIETRDIDAFFAVLDGAKAENEIQAMLAIQMAANRILAMKSARTLFTCKEIPQQDSNALTLSRLHRNFALQAETLSKLQRGGKHKVVVEHVHVYPGGQAIVGNVTTPTPEGTGAVFQNGNQPHAIERSAADAVSNCGAVPCQNPQREALPIAYGEREKAVPDARRGGRLGRTNRAA